MVVVSAGDDLSQAVSGGSGSALASSTVVVATVVAAGAHVVSDLVFRRVRYWRNFFSQEALFVRNLSILRMLPAKSWKATNTLWAATPRMRRRSGSSTASRAPSLKYPCMPSFELLDRSYPS
jgi:hypothetical protein